MSNVLMWHLKSYILLNFKPSLVLADIS